MGRDGKGHPTMSHNPSTLRLSCPFWHQLPRPDPSNPDAPGNLIRNLIVPARGNILAARDFSGIEAVLVGYEARSPAYIRLAKMDVHSYYTAWALYELDKSVSANDLPDIGWDDARLAQRLGEIKKEFKWERNMLYKHLVHAINFGQGAKGAQEKIYKDTDILHDTRKIAKVMGVYKELFPAIPQWHHDVRLAADKDGYLRNAFGYIHRFNHVFHREWKDGEWVKRPGDDAEAVLAFKPQSNAAGIIKEAILRLYQTRFEEAGQWLRLQIHDEIFWECPEPLVDEVDAVVQEEMERPIPEMALPPEWGMGSHLVVLTEGKRGYKWGMMQ